MTYPKYARIRLRKGADPEQVKRDLGFLPPTEFTTFAAYQFMERWPLLLDNEGIEVEGSPPKLAKKGAGGGEEKP